MKLLCKCYYHLFIFYFFIFQVYLFHLILLSFQETPVHGFLMLAASVANGILAPVA